MLSLGIIVWFGNALWLGGTTMDEQSSFENLLVRVEPKNGGPTGYGAGLLMRDGAKRNTVRFSTVALDDAPCVKIIGTGSQTRLIGNILTSKKQAVDGEAIAEQNFTGADPLLSTEFFPKPGSPVIAAATIDHPATDHAGRQRPTPCSLGAFEPRK